MILNNVDIIEYWLNNVDDYSCTTAFLMNVDAWVRRSFNLEMNY